MNSKSAQSEKPAVFWDRDKTLIEDPGYINHPDQVKLLPGAAEAIRRLSEAGFENVIITNQSGIARGMFDEETLARIHDRLQELLAEQGAKVDAVYFCPYLPGEEAVVEAYRQDSDLRKPKPGMYIKAAMERKLSLAGSWAVGDRLRDAQGGRAAGCRTIVIAHNGVEATQDAAEARNHRDVDFVADSLTDVANIVIERTRKTQSSKTKQTSQADDSTAVLKEILGFLRTVDKKHSAENFSIARLLGAVVQILALAALLWSIFGMLLGAGEGSVITGYRLLLTIALQAMALTCFVIPTKK